jgi:hypothetical protein
MLTDISLLHDFCEGDVENIKKYIQLYLKAVPPFQEKFSNAILQTNKEDIALLIHGFKPKWAMMGMNETTQLAAGIETMCNAEAELITGQLAQVLEHTEKSAEELSQILKTI